jgi:hypothetical protein
MFAIAAVAFIAFDHGCTGTGENSDIEKVGAISPRPFLLPAVPTNLGGLHFLEMTPFTGRRPDFMFDAPCGSYRSTVD